MGAGRREAPTLPLFLESVTTTTIQAPVVMSVVADGYTSSVQIPTHGWSDRAEADVAGGGIGPHGLRSFVPGPAAPTFRAHPPGLPQPSVWSPSTSGWSRRPAVRQRKPPPMGSAAPTTSISVESASSGELHPFQKQNRGGPGRGRPWIRGANERARRTVRRQPHDGRRSTSRR